MGLEMIRWMKPRETKMATERAFFIILPRFKRHCPGTSGNQTWQWEIHRNPPNFRFHGRILYKFYKKSWFSIAMFDSRRVNRRIAVNSSVSTGVLFGNPSLPRVQLRVLRSVSCGLRDQGGGVCLVLDRFIFASLIGGTYRTLGYIRTMGSGTAVPAMVEPKSLGSNVSHVPSGILDPQLIVTVGHRRYPWITTFHGANLRSQHSALITQAKGRCAVSDI